MVTRQFPTFSGPDCSSGMSAAVRGNSGIQSALLMHAILFTASFEGPPRKK